MGELDNFRADVRAWLESNYPAPLRDPNMMGDPEAAWGGRAFTADCNDPHFDWIRKLAERGWTATASPPVPD